MVGDGATVAEGNAKRRRTPTKSFQTTHRDTGPEAPSESKYKETWPSKWLRFYIITNYGFHYVEA
jgi:hypothetical protein